MGRASSVLVLALILGGLSGFPVGSSQASAGQRVIPVGTVLYLWYGWNSSVNQWTGGLGTSHWNDSVGNIVKDMPDKGYYASLSNDTLAYQFNQIKAAGFSWILFSWWGWGDNWLNGTQDHGIYQAINNATINAFRYLKANSAIFPFKVGLIVEPFNATAENTPSGSARVYGYVGSHFYRPYNSSIFYWQGYPLITSFNPVYLQANYTFTYRTIGARPNDQGRPNFWYFWDGISSYYLTAAGGSAQPQNYEYAPTISFDGEVGIVPRYDDFYQRPSGYMRFDPARSLGLYNAEWNYLAANRGKINLVLVYGWNEYHERTALECAEDFTSGHYCGAGETEYYISHFEAYPDNPTTNPQDPWGAILPVVALAAILGTALLVVVIVRRIMR
jgi:hypothetical protein